MNKTLDFTLAEVAQITGGDLLRGEPQAHINVISTNTRSLVGGNTLFVAFRGEAHDGHAYLDQAASSGATAALVEKAADAPPGLALVQVQDTRVAYGRLARAHRDKYDIPIVGVTGSYGKTTTRLLVAQVLSSSFNVLASEGNFNNEIGVPLTLLKLDPPHQAAVVEMGMRGLGQIRYLTTIARPTDGIVTNVGPQHIEHLGSLDNIAAAKAELLEVLPENGLAVLPGDDQYVDFFRSRCSCRCVTFGERDADWKAQDIKMDNSGKISFTVVGPEGQTQTIHLPLSGHHNAVNATAAIALGFNKGITLQDMADRLAYTPSLDGRLRDITNDARRIVIIDDTYNAGPNSMRAALDNLRDRPGKHRKVAILGEMMELGKQAEAEHKSIGEHARFCVSTVIGIGKMSHWTLEPIRPNVDTYWLETVDDALEGLDNLIRSDSIVLVKGSRSTHLERIVEALAALPVGV